MYCFNGACYNINNGVGIVVGVRRPEPRVAAHRTIPDVPQGRPRQKYLSHHRALSHSAKGNGRTASQCGWFDTTQSTSTGGAALRRHDLFVSGLLDGGDEIAQRAAIIDVPSGNGHVLLFSTNPFWRGQTKGSYFLIFNAILNWDNLNAGRKLDDK